MWVGEQITERGIGNGISLIIFAGIVDRHPRAASCSYFADAQGQHPAAQPRRASARSSSRTVATIVFFERGQRRSRSTTRGEPSAGASTAGRRRTCRCSVNTAGTIPPIFASSLLMFPATLANFNDPGHGAAPGDASSAATGSSTRSTSLLIVFFCYFYTAVTFQPVDVADNLKKQQAFIPSIRQGKQTADYIDHVLTRITLGGALYVAVVCVVPTIISEAFHVPFRWGGTSIMIVVGVALDTVSQIEAHLITRNYEGLSGGGGTRHAHPRPEGRA